MPWELTSPLQDLEVLGALQSCGGQVIKCPLSIQPMGLGWPKLATGLEVPSARWSEVREGRPSHGTIKIQPGCGMGARAPADPSKSSRKQT